MANFTPVAQTFTVDSNVYPKGMFATSVDLCFRTKDDVTKMPVSIELRPVSLGQPDRSIVHPFSHVSLTPKDIKTSLGSSTDLPSFTDATKYTRFTFSAPVYLPPGDHAIVVNTASNGYDLYTAELGQQRLDSERVVSGALFSGNFYKSQNGTDYIAVPGIALMFNVNRAVFTTNTDEQVVLLNRNPGANLIYNIFNTKSLEQTFDGTNVSYSASLGNDTSSLNKTDILLNQDYSLGGRLTLANVTTTNTDGKLYTANATFATIATLNTTDDKISPIINTDRVQTTIVRNVINNGGLSNAIFSVVNGGSTQTYNASNTTVTITGSSGTGAVCYANISGGAIVGIDVDPDYPGSGYIDDITATISVSGGTAAGANVAVATELTPRGGPVIAKYITRKVILNDGFDAKDLRVFFDANIPAGTSVYVYYKVLAKEDPDLFDTKPYYRMKAVQQGNPAALDTYTAPDENSTHEYMFVPQTAPITYTSTTTGTTYTSFLTFAIKVVMLSSNDAVVPKIKNFRAMALDT